MKKRHYLARDGIIVEFLYLAVLDDGEKFQFVAKDTLQHPLNFLECIAELRDEQSLIATQESLNFSEVYGFYGHEKDVDMFKDILLERSFGLSMSSVISGDPDDDSLIEPTTLEVLYGKSLDEFLNLCSPIARIVTPWSKASYLRMYDDEEKFALLIMTAGDAFPGKNECLLSLKQFAEAWIEQEEPVLLKHQIITTSFLLNSTRGKRIIAPFFNPCEHEWELLLEGARRINLGGEGPLIDQQTDSSIVGRWTEVDIEQILMNPAYGYGIHILPYHIADEWINALLYCCAISIYIRKWSLNEARSIYRDFLEMLKARLPYETSEAIVDEDIYLESFLMSAERTAKSLRGIEESSLTRRFALEMPYRVYQLNAIMPILRKNLPDALTLPLEPQAFSCERFCELLENCKASTASDKGIALENLAAYMLSAVEGWLLAGRRVKADDCEIDLCYVNASLNQDAWDMGAILLVECKNRVEITGVSVVRNLSFVMDAKGSRTGLIVSMSGFSKVAVEQSTRLACQGKSILLIDGDDLNAIAGGVRPSVLVGRKYRTLQKEVEDDLGQLY